MVRGAVALMGVGVLGAFLLAPGSAAAACIDILKEWQRTVPDRFSSNAVDREVERANAAQKRGNERACREHMRNAHSMLRNPPSYRQPRDDRGWRDPRYAYPSTRWGYGEPSYQPGWGWGRPQYDGRYGWGREYDGR
jgi:hypothetical protein